MNLKSNYRNLHAYVEAKTLVRLVYSVLRKFPKEEQDALCDQLRRAVISIPYNIAEGMGRMSQKEQVHFIEIAFGSLMEVGSQMDVAADLQYVSIEELDEIDNQIDVVASLLSGLRNKRIATPLTNNQ